MKDKIEARMKKLGDDMGQAVQKLAVLRAEVQDTEQLISRMQGAQMLCKELLQPEPIDNPGPAEPPPEVRNGERPTLEEAQENGR
jgi:hypothetical protein